MLALYRKYRPIGFDEVIGQEHITRTLINQIASGRVSHAYLFTGSRGTGKTTCARIFARAVNCLNPRNGSPCGECEVCKALQGKENVDVVELDAASNNSVDQVRTLIENVQYLPAAGKYKVYVIDEVHMLSSQAFNALLKTLEEPPKHVIFILATTEVHKVLPTILSRCMRFDFKLVGRDVLVDYLKWVYKQEKVSADEDAIQLIAAAAEGSVRDMLSLADRCLNAGERLTYELTSAIIGSSGRRGARTLFTALSEGNIGASLTAVNKLCGEGKSVSLIAKDLVAYMRDLLLLKTASTELVLGSSEEIGKMSQEAEKVSVDFLVTAITVFSAIDGEMRYSVAPKIVLEAATLRVCKQAVTDLSAIDDRLTKLEHKIESGNFVSAASGEKKQADANKPMDARSLWGRVLTYARSHETPLIYNLLCEVTKVDVEVDRKQIVIVVSADNFLRFSADDVTSGLKRALLYDGIDYEVVINKQAAGVDMDSEVAKIKKMIGDAKLNIKK